MSMVYIEHIKGYELDYIRLIVQLMDIHGIVVDINGLV